MSTETADLREGRARAPRRRCCPRWMCRTSRWTSLIPAEYLRAEPAPLPEVSEIEVVRHYTHLSQRNFGVDTGFYPLGSCTMKYNPKVNEDMAGAARLRAHPSAGAREHDAGRAPAALRAGAAIWPRSPGMARVTLQPAAGAHGEITGLMIIKAYHEQSRRGPPQHRADPRRRARHQSGQRHPGRLHHRRAEVGRARRRGSGPSRSRCWRSTRARSPR